ncbi:PAS domain S-box-containing protein [Massilia sp. MP_M2]|uniref:hybrid sensor histidine kinase/response regulator n=1 Tax=Massilia sp. MP_M2 TaxID=3071713 RepID=UPI00319E6D67
MHSPDEYRAEIDRLRKTTRDLVAMTTLPAVWGELPPEGVIDSLAGVLLSTLDLDLVCIHLPGKGEIEPLEIIRIRRDDTGSMLRAARAALDAAMQSADGHGMRPGILQDDDAPLQLGTARLGIGSDPGVVVIGARRAGFPSEHERLLLGVAANQAAAILQRRLAERALARSESRFQDLADAAPAMLWVTEPDGKLSFLSRAWHEFTGQDKGTSLAFGWTAAVHPDERAAALHAVIDANARRAPFSIEQRLQHADDGYRWVIATGQPRFAANGDFLGFVGNVLDISDRKRTEQALHETRDTLVTMFDALPVGVSVADQDGKLLLSNQAMHRYLPTGVLPSLDEERYLRWTAFDADGQPLERRNFAGARASRGERVVPGIEARYLGDDGVEIWTQVAAVPLMGRDNVMRGHVVIVTDIDAFKRTEAALRLAESRQRDLFDEVARANRNLSEFLAVLAHELRNPLAPLLTGLELMRVGHGDADAVANVRGMMERQVRQLAHLIDDLLDIARVTNGKVDIRKTRVDLNTIVADAVETSLPLIEQKRHGLDLQLHAGALPVQADATRIAQVVGNLLTNAAKYTPPGGAISLRVTQDGTDAVIAVSDNGVGIPATSLESVFEMFSQVGSNRQHAQGGLGIGLSLVRQLVKLHNGVVSAHSDGVGKGSTFTVRLALDGATQAPAPLPADRLSAQGTPAAPALRILVTDDNVDAALTLSMLLEIEGHDVTLAHDGQQALQVAAHYLPDVVFLDIGLPDMSGLEVARRLRQIAGLEHCAIVAVSGWGAQDDLARSSAAGFDAHFTKPVAPKRVRDYLAVVAASMRST